MKLCFRSFILGFIAALPLIFLENLMGSQTLQNYGNASLSISTPLIVIRNQTTAQSPKPPERRKSKHIFVDGGANRGDTFLSLLNEDTFFAPSVARRDIDVYLFEAAPIWNDLLHDFYQRYTQIKRVYNATAIWTNSSEKLTFFMHGDNHEASSSFHKSGNMTEVTVDCVDICEWLEHDMQFEIDDYIIVKIDVEGAEYPLMEHIYNDSNCISLIDEMFVEWHPWGQKKWNDGVEHHYLDWGKLWTERFRNKGVKMHKWD